MGATRRRRDVLTGEERMRILLVDDSLTIRTLIRRSLADVRDAEIVEAANGVDALTQIARRRFDLVVLDMNMPVMDGLETLEALRSSPDYAALPVVMLTSEKNEALVRRLVELRITDFLSKPLSPEVLSHRITRVIERLREGDRLPVLRVSDEAARRTLIVEQDPDRRHFLMTALAGHYNLTEADSAAAALQVCMGDKAPRFDVVLVGPHVGLPPVEMFVAKARVPITISQDPARLRPNDTPIVLGDRTRIQEDTGWSPQIPLEQTVDDLLEYWRSSISEPRR
jgi:CheY-like chemotaxis protein